MLFKTTLLASTFALLSNAQSSTSRSPPTPSGSVKNHVVQVGDATGALKFSPDSITAAVGEMIQFQFYPQNHSVAQSSFDKPCEPLPQTNGTAGFWSGFMPVSSSSTTMPTFSILVKDTKPIWFYCAAAKHCQGGMSGVVNPPSSGPNTLDAYKTAAKSVSLTGIPTGAAGSGGSGSGSSGSGSNSTSSSGGGSGSGSGSGTSGGTSVPTTTPSSGASELLVWNGWAAVVCGIVGLLMV